MNETLERNAINPNNESNSPNNKTNTFNLVIGIATLLIALLGATFAYFSATATSAENDVTVKSAYVSIYYDGGTEIKASNLIPATENVALKKYQKEFYAINPETGESVIQPYNPMTDNDEDGEPDGYIKDYDVYKNDVDRKCVDAKGREVCYVYQFSIESDGALNSETEILAYIKINKNEFDHLSYVLYEVKLKKDDQGNVLKDKYEFGIVDSYTVVSEFNNTDTVNNIEFADVKFAKFEKPYDIYDEDGNFSKTINPFACLFGYVEDISDIDDNNPERCKPYKLTNKEKHTYQLVIWLEETGAEQKEQGKAFEGTVSIEVSGGLDSGDDGKITGQE